MSQSAAVQGWFFCACFSHTLEVGPHGPHVKAFFEEAFYGKSLRNVSAKIEEGRRRGVGRGNAGAPRATAAAACAAAGSRDWDSLPGGRLRGFYRSPS